MIKKIYLIMVLQTSFANLTDFHADDVPLIESLSVNHYNGIQINKYANGQHQFNGNQFIRLEISNNSAKGYKIYATSSNGKLKTASRSVSGNEINYRLVCDAYQSATGGSTVASSGQVDLNSNFKTLVYDVNDPFNITDRARPFCSLTLVPNESLQNNFAGRYTDTITFELVTNDD